MTDIATPDRQTVDLHIGGMTCSSCAVRVEKKLNRLPGVEAEVNYATEIARVSLPDDVTVEQAIATVEATGYHAELPAPPATDPRDLDPDAEVDEEHPRPAADRDPELASLLQQLQNLHGADCAGGADGDDPGAAVHVLAVGIVDAGGTGRGLGCLAFPSSCLEEPPARRRDDGHPHQPRCQRGLPVVAVRIVPG